MSLKWFYSLWHQIVCVKTSKANSVLVFKPLLSEEVILSLNLPLFCIQWFLLELLTINDNGVVAKDLIVVALWENSTMHLLHCSWLHGDLTTG